MSCPELGDLVKMQPVSLSGLAKGMELQLQDDGTIDIVRENQQIAQIELSPTGEIASLTVRQIHPMSPRQFVGLLRYCGFKFQDPPKPGKRHLHTWLHDHLPWWLGMWVPGHSSKVRASLIKISPPPEEFPGSVG